MRGPGFGQRIARTAIVLALGAFALAGCEDLMVATGTRVRLDDTPLQSLSATLASPQGLAPGASAALAIVATTPDGRQLATAGTGDGTVLADSYGFQASVVTVSKNGVVSLPADPRASEGQVPRVRITPAGRTAPVAELDILVRYDVPFMATYAGRDGLDGSAGLDGAAGLSGSMGSFDVDHPVAGGDGSNGGDGQDGSAGGDGAAAPDILVLIGPDPGRPPLLRVRVSEGGRDHFFLVDPDGGSLSIKARGGVAGSGGAGGRGGAGGQGGMGQPSGNAGLAGHDGNSGHPGSGGAAGRIAVEVDPAASRYLAAFHFTNEDGNGRPGPAPDIVTAAVPALW